jgi:hypothetical protein
MEDFVTPLNKVLISFKSSIGDEFLWFYFYWKCVTKTPTKITLRENSSTTNAIIQWDLLVKK